MSKKNDKVKANVKTDEKVVENDVVFVRVIQNFNDATDNNNFVSAGKNSFYRTNKERADMLVKDGYCEYEDDTEVDNVTTDDNTDDNSDSNITDDSNVDNGTTDDTNDVTTDNNSDDTNTSDNVDDNNNANDNTDDNSNPNE